MVINATGIFSDDLRRMDEPSETKILSVSQGTHIVLPREFLPGDSALMIPRTSDGRVLFAIPWHDRIVVGTTDDPVPQPEYEPRAMEDERRFLVEYVERYLGRRPSRNEILSMWSWPAAAGETRRCCQHGCDFARSHRAHLEIETSYDNRRQVDYLPKNGRRCDQSRGRFGGTVEDNFQNGRTPAARLCRGITRRCYRIGDTSMDLICR